MWTTMRYSMSNGCGCERGVLRFVRPPYASKYYAACALHDNDYDIGGSEADRKEADARLFDNMQRISRRASRNPFALVWFTHIALLYYVSVRAFGRFYFNYTTKE